jgi:hypothetical protein
MNVIVITAVITGFFLCADHKIIEQRIFRFQHSWEFERWRGRKECTVCAGRHRLTVVTKKRYLRSFETFFKEVSPCV